MKSMREWLEAGYEVVVESMFGDVPVADVEDADERESECQFSRVDEEQKVAYFEEADCGQYDE